MEPTLDPGLPAQTVQPTQAAPLKAGVSVTDVRPAKSFQSIIDENADVWPTLKPEQVQKAATKYLDTFVHPLPGFKALNDEQKNNFYTEFNKKYDVGHVGLDSGVVDNPLDKAFISAQRLGDLATLGIPARAWDAANMNEVDTAGQRDSQLSQYANDPGMYGEMYRASQNPIVKGIGGMAGMLHGTSGIVDQVEKSGLGALSSAATYANKFAKPFLGNAQKAAFSIGATGWNALNHGMSAMRGDETASQALMGLGLDTAALPIGGKNRWTNAAAQGAAGGASSVGGDLIHGKPVDWKRAGQEAITQAGVGLAFHGGHGEKTKKEQPPHQNPPDGGAPPAAPPVKHDLKQLAIDLHAALNSNHHATRMEAKQRLADLKAMARDKRSSTNPAKIRKPGSDSAKEILTHLEMHTQEMRKESGKRKIIGTSNEKAKHEELAQKAFKYRAKGGKIAANFENYLDRNYSKEDKRIINARVKELRGEVATEKTTEKERTKVRREKGIEKVKTINQTRQEAQREARKAENDLINSEKAKQQAENEKQQQDEAAAKKAKAREESGSLILQAVKEATGKPSEKSGTAMEHRAAGPDEYKRMSAESKSAPKAKPAEKPVVEKPKPKQAPVLDNADIEQLANELLAHKQANEKGQLEAKLTEHRSASKADHTKTGATPERSEAIKKSHQRVLDAYAQKQAEATTKPSAVEMKAGQEANRKALAKLNEEGGKYTPGEATAKQKPSTGYTLDEIKKTQEWDKLDAETKRKAELIHATAQKDGKGIAEYDAERSGDTHQFKNKTLTPTSFDVLGTPESPKLVMHATNENGHDHTYYISPSKGNEKTGFSSYLHDFTPLGEFDGKGKRGLEGHAYHGERDVQVKDILSRPADRTAGYTSETEAMLMGDKHGQDVHAIRKAIKRQAKNKEQPKTAEASKVIDKMAEQSKAVQDTIVKVNQGKATPKEGEALTTETKKVKGKSREKLAKDTGC